MGRGKKGARRLGEKSKRTGEMKADKCLRKATLKSVLLNDTWPCALARGQQRGGDIATMGVSRGSVLTAAWKCLSPLWNEGFCPQDHKDQRSLNVELFGGAENEANKAICYSFINGPLLTM